MSGVPSCQMMCISSMQDWCAVIIQRKFYQVIPSHQAMVPSLELAFHTMDHHIDCKSA